MELTRVHIVLVALPSEHGPQLQTFVFSDKGKALTFAVKQIVTWFTQNKEWLLDEFPHLKTLFSVMQGVDAVESELIFLLYRIEIQTAIGPEKPFSEQRPILERFIHCELIEDRQIDMESLPKLPQLPKSRTDLLEIE
jgi:hypothetical protein